MKKLIICISAMLITSVNGLSQTPQEVSTRFGLLSVNENNRLLFKGQSLNPPVDGNNSLEIGKVNSIGSADVVLVTDNGGTGCPFLYYFVTVSNAGAKSTPFFGTCAEVASMKVKGDSITLVLPGFRGPSSSEATQVRASKERHIFVFRRGVVTKNGKRVK